MEIRLSTRRLAEKVYPGLTARALSSRINDDLDVLYLEWLTRTRPEDDDSGEQPEQAPLPIDVPAPVTARDITDHLAAQAPAIDVTNWAQIKTGIQTALDLGTWTQNAETQLLNTLCEPFDNAKNARRVQNSRIRAYFQWLND